MSEQNEKIHQCTRVELSSVIELYGDLEICKCDVCGELWKVKRFEGKFARVRVGSSKGGLAFPYTEAMKYGYQKTKATG